MTQLEQATQAARELIQNPLDEQSLRDLRRALEAAQNRPPQGASDESFTPAVWAEFMTLQNSFVNVQRVVGILKGTGIL